MEVERTSNGLMPGDDDEMKLNTVYIRVGAYAEPWWRLDKQKTCS